MGGERVPLAAGRRGPGWSCLWILRDGVGLPVDEPPRPTGGGADRRAATPEAGPAGPRRSPAPAGPWELACILRLH